MKFSRNRFLVAAMAAAVVLSTLPAAAERLREPVWVVAHAGHKMMKAGWMVSADDEYIELETREGVVLLRWDLLDRAGFEAAAEGRLGEKQRAWRRGERERAWEAVAVWLEAKGKPEEWVDWAEAKAESIRNPAAEDAAAAGFDFEALDPLGRWGELSEGKHAEGLAEQVAFMEEAMEKTGLRLDAYPEASEHFLLYTDLSEREANKWAAKLDAMHEAMCPIFGLEPGAKIHFGRTLVVVLERRADFMEFAEDVFDEQEPDEVHGFAAGRPDGHVRIVFYRQPEDDEFERILVHEAAHAVVHRLRSPVHAPSWINEGIAELVDRRLVPTQRGPRVTPRLAQAALEDPAAFFGPSHRIAYRDYPLAEGFVSWLIRGSGPRFRELFDGLKAGLEVDAVFEHAYGRSPVEVLAAYAATLD